MLKEKEIDADVERISIDGLDGVSGGFTFGAKDEESFYETAMLIANTFGFDESIDVMAGLYNLDIDSLTKLRRHYYDNAAEFWRDVTLSYFHGKTIYV